MARGRVRRIGRNLLLLTAGVFGSVCTVAREQSSAPDKPPQEYTHLVHVEYFYEKGCPVCDRIAREVLPVLEHQYAGLCLLRKRDTGDEANYLALVSYIERLDITTNAPAIIVVDGRYPYAGWTQIQAGVIPKVEELIAIRLSSSPEDTPPIVSPTDEHVPSHEARSELLTRRLRGFTLAGVLVGGLADGINPCAISTLVFFLSMLSVLKIRGGRLIMVGLTFCVTSFLTYGAIGLGLLGMLGLLDGLEPLRAAVRALMVALLALFAFLSFRDAARFHHSGNPSDVSLQLPDRIKQYIHRIIHGGLERRRLFFGTVMIAVAVTALESVCTGQVYVPTLVLIVKTGENAGRGRALGYLLLYNAMFILPLVVAFVLTYRGLKTRRLLQWSRSNVVSSKVLMGCFFVAMAVLLLWL